MYLAAVEFGTISGEGLVQNVVAAILYFLVGIAVLVAGFLMVDQLGQGLVDAAVYGVVGVAIQGVALVVLELVVPGRFRDLITDERLHPAAIATAVMLMAVGAVNAAALS